MINDFRGEYRYLSNFHLVDVAYDGEVYPSTEHAFQAAKTLNEEERKEIQEAATPSIAKKLGKKVTLRSNWDSIRVGVMQALLEQKFKYPDLRKKLLATQVGGMTISGEVAPA